MHESVGQRGHAARLDRLVISDGVEVRRVLRLPVLLQGGEWHYRRFAARGTAGLRRNIGMQMRLF